MIRLLLGSGNEWLAATGTFGLIRFKPHFESVQAKMAN
jgi:hypothetical protein